MGRRGGWDFCFYLPPQVLSFGSSWITSLAISFFEELLTILSSAEETFLSPLGSSTRSVKTTTEVKERRNKRGQTKHSGGETLSQGSSWGR